MSIKISFGQGWGQKLKIYHYRHQFFDIYIPIVEGVFIFDNSLGNHELIAAKAVHDKLDIFEAEKFKELKNHL